MSVVLVGRQWMIKRGGGDKMRCQGELTSAWEEAERM